MADKNILVLVTRCTTCKERALKWLDILQVLIRLRDIKEENPTVEELAEWHKLSVFHQSSLQHQAWYECVIITSWQSFRR